MMAHFQSNASRHDFLRQGNAITEATVYSLLLTWHWFPFPTAESSNEINKRRLETVHPHTFFLLSTAADEHLSIKPSVHLYWSVALVLPLQVLCCWPWVSVSGKVMLLRYNPGGGRTKPDPVTNSQHQPAVSLFPCSRSECFYSVVWIWIIIP